MSDETEDKERSILVRIADAMNIDAVRKAIVAALDGNTPEPDKKDVDEAKTRFEDFVGE